MSSATEKLRALRHHPYLFKDRKVYHGDDFCWVRFNTTIGNFSPIDREAHKVACRIGDLVCVHLREVQKSIIQGELPKFIKDRVAERDANIAALDEATKKTIPQEILETIREFYPF